MDVDVPWDVRTSDFTGTGTDLQLAFSTEAKVEELAELQEQRASV